VTDERSRGKRNVSPAPMWKRFYGFQPMIALTVNVLNDSLVVQLLRGNVSAVIKRRFHGAERWRLNDYRRCEEESYSVHVKVQTRALLQNFRKTRPQ
jgi:hypothetical protein